MVKILYTIKRSRVGKPIKYTNLDAMLKALEQILRGREKSGFLGKIWLTVEAKHED